MSKLFASLSMLLMAAACQAPQSGRYVIDSHDAEYFELNYALGESELIEVTSDAHEGVRFSFRILTSAENTITGMRFITPEGPFDFSLSDLPRGLALMEKDGRRVVTLYSSNFNPSVGGDFTLRYLYSGISGKTKDLPLRVQREGGTWMIYTNKAREGLRRFTRMFLKANRAFLVGIIGIEEVIVH